MQPTYDTFSPALYPLRYQPACQPDLVGGAFGGSSWQIRGGKIFASVLTGIPGYSGLKPRLLRINITSLSVSVGVLIFQCWCFERKIIFRTGNPFRWMSRLVRWRSKSWRLWCSKRNSSGHNWRNTKSWRRRQRRCSLGLRFFFVKQRFMASQPIPPNVPPPRNKGLIRPY